jgi:hypothetical protein
VIKLLSPAEVACICAGLDLPIAATVDGCGCVDVQENRPLNTEEYVHARMAFMVRTDAPIRWHRATP